MSHFVYTKTTFQNIFFLKKVLTALKIDYKEKQIKNQNLTKSHIDLVISQSNGHDISFCWNGQDYDFIFDRSFWKQNCSPNSFIDNINQKYAREVVLSESQKIGFQPVKYEQNSNSEKLPRLILERFNFKTNKL